MLWNHRLVTEYTQWLEAYYKPGSTVRNKCLHLKSLIKYIRMNIRGANEKTIQSLIRCKKILADAAQTNKLVAQQNTNTRKREYFLIHKGKS